MLTFLVLAGLLAPVVLPKPPAWVPTPLQAVEAPPPPFKARKRKVKAMKPKGKGIVDLKRWPAEPLSPKTVDEAKLAKVLPKLCGWMGAKRRAKFAGWFLKYAAQYKVDPFLLAATVYRSSRCLPHFRAEFGLGLGGVNLGMHRTHVTGKTYTYHVLEESKWVTKTLELPTKLSRGQVKRQEMGIAWAAALLAIAKAQCPHNDGVFGSAPHRHFVSHYVWGDRVRGAGAEDRVLRARRRLLAYYLETTPPMHPAALWPASEANPGEPVPFTAPLGASPRKVFSGLGKPRANGKRKHKGIDFDSSGGEPVLAIAKGKVLWAGVDWPRGTASERMPFADARKLRSSTMGPGGLFVMIHHGDTRISAYMHLATYTVVTGDKVEAGQIIGSVGRTGVKSSGAHLHFEMRQNGKHMNPLKLMAPYVFDPSSTWYGSWDASVALRRLEKRLARKAARAEAKKVKAQKAKARRAARAAAKAEQIAAAKVKRAARKAKAAAKKAAAEAKKAAAKAKKAAAKAKKAKATKQPSPSR